MSVEPSFGGYEVTVEKRHGFWLVLVQNLGVTHAQSLIEIEPLARDLVATTTGQSPAGVLLTWSFHVHVERCGAGWHLHVGDIGVTRCRTLAFAEWDVQEYLETVLEHQPATTALTWDLTGIGRSSAASPVVAAEVDSFINRFSFIRRDRE